MNKIEARNIGTSFLKKRSFDSNIIGERDKLGEIFDYNIFYSFAVVSENGSSYLGGAVVLLDKRTKFCLLVANSPNYNEYHIRLFRIMKLHELYDEKIDYLTYSNKKTNLNYNDYVQAIFLLLKSHPNNLNAFLAFLDFLVLVEEYPIKEDVLKELHYKAVSSNEETLEIFFKGCEIFENNSLVKAKVGDLERNLLKKKITIQDIFQKNNQKKQRLQELRRSRRNKKDR